MNRTEGNACRVIVAAAVLACVVVAAARLGSASGKRTGSRAEELAVHKVEAAISVGESAPRKLPDYVGAFARNMDRTEPPVSETSCSWVFHPQPPGEEGRGDPLDPDAARGTLSQGNIAVLGSWVGKARVKVSFGAKDQLWRARALLVWRKPKAGMSWPADPLMTIKLTREGGGPPPGVTALGDGAFAFLVEDLKAREPYEYRVQAAAAFPAVGEKISSPDGREQRLFEGVDGGGRPEAPEALDRLLGGPAYLSAPSAPVTVELPGDVQIRYDAPVTVGEGQEQASFTIRFHSPAAVNADQDGWCTVYNKRFAPGADVKLSGERISVFVDKAAGRQQLQRMDKDPEARLVRLLVKLVPIIIEERKPRLDDQGRPVTDGDGNQVYVVERRQIGVKKVRVAVLLDKRTNETVALTAKADGGDWWPGHTVSPPAEPRRPEAP